MTRTTPLLAAMTTAFFVLSACSSSAGVSPSTSTQPSASANMPMASEDHSESFAFGEPVEAADADRVIAIKMLDQLKFDPASIEVKVGETITFMVINTGTVEHDFTLGDEETQAGHEAAMAGGMAGMGHDEPNQLTLKPGTEGELTWHFPKAMSVLYGCHVIGHYDAGMVGSVVVAGS